MAIEYKNLLENLVSKPNLVIHEDDTLNKQELTQSTSVTPNRWELYRLEIIRYMKTIILLVVIRFRKKHLKRLKKQVILVVVEKKEHKKSMNYKELKRNFRKT